MVLGSEYFSHMKSFFVIYLTYSAADKHTDLRRLGRGLRLKMHQLFCTSSALKACRSVIFSFLINICYCTHDS